MRRAVVGSPPPAKKKCAPPADVSCHGPECAQLLENNRDVAKAIWEDDGTDEETAKTISASYVPLTETETVKNWKSDALGEGPKMADIKKMIGEKAGTVPEVDDIMAQNAEKNPITGVIVEQGEDGLRRINLKKSTSLALAAAGHNAQKLQELEARMDKKGGR